MVAKHIGFDFECVFHFKFSACCLQQTLVAHLATRLCVERGCVQNDHAVLTGFELCGWRALNIQGQHLRGGLQFVVTHEGIARTGVFQRTVHLEFTGRAGLGFLAFHGGGKASFVHAQIALSANVGRQVQGEAIGVVQFESHFAGQYFDATFKGCVQNLHAYFECFKEAFLFGFQNVGDAFFLRCQTWIGRAHQHHKVGHQLVEERRLLAQLVTVANGTAHNASLHIATTFVTGHHTITHQESSGTNVIGNDAQRFVLQIGTTRFARCRFDQ